MSKSFSASGTSHEEGVGTLGVLAGKLVESDDLASGFDDSSSGSFGDSESADSDLGDGEESDVVGNCGNSNGGSVIIASQVLNYS
eukprot:CAMPEP_0114586680 /NCGR_PEP_ID=MMETSP0125-20121206/9833_1 /TAXON_ID=485358 ORGANISM="Aristerostoma sp., Strain ATCC 50986" /NCGR_SAMPLE_ID=MMETSP0125 /ASSEMBLY_ACC=CAM_ASM_000245 /LENGTH=84 /DNA_ID=CAMNT_0001782219 /DNA_START=320 /DNA_END=574 /DNA_ORIENTATION=-